MQITEVEIALDARAELGECPLWHAAERRLYWVDIWQNELHRFDPATGTDECRRFDQSVGCFAFRERGELVLGMKDGFALLDNWDAHPVPFGPQFLEDEPDLRLNDGRADAGGRFWAGSVDDAKKGRRAALYCLEPDGRVSEIESGLITSNAAAFSADGRSFCHTDTPTHRLHCHDADPASGALSNRRVLASFPEGGGAPDGGSFDMEGCYWSALFAVSEGGGKVVRISPKGEILATVELPTPRTTMIGFGGEDMRTAYVTSARALLTEQELQSQPNAGAIFSFRVDVPGVPEFTFAG